MNKTPRILLASGLLACAPLASADEDGIASYFSANVTLTSDYIWRGVSQTDESGAIQGGVDFALPIGIYAGIWGSNVNFDDVKGDSATAEFDFYGGYSHTFDMGLGVDVGLIRYQYPRTSGLNWTEYYLKGSYSFAGLDFGLGVNYSNNVFDSDEDGIYYEGSVGYTLSEDMGYFAGLTIDGGAAYYDFDDKVFGNEIANSYWNWNVGLSKDFFGFTVDLRYFGTDSDGKDIFSNKLAGNHYVASISKSF